MPQRWNDAAETRKRQIESGIDITFSKVFVPYYIDMVKQHYYSSMLEVGCGTGHLSAELRERINKVVSIEPSVGMYNVACQVLKDKNITLHNVKIEDYKILDEYDLILSHMCLHLVDDITLCIDSICHHMNINSEFVFAIPHPCFYNNHKSFFNSYEYNYMQTISKDVSFSITDDPKTVITNVPYIHRPISEYFAALKSCNLCVINFEEIFPEKAVQLLYGKEWLEPRYCVFHTKKLFDRCG